MSKPKNDTFLRALLREATPYTPIWIMRQAGRYLPEYNQTRARAGSFLDLCKNPDFATEVTLQPLTRYPLDAAILFCDILTIPDAMGLGLYFAEGEGPRFHHPLRDERDVRKLIAPDPAIQLSYVLDAVAQIRKALAGSIPLLGFSGSPFTLACYMIEGRGGTDFHETKKMLYERPALLHQLLEVNARAVTDYLNDQIEAGVQAVMIFDTWGGMLAGEAFHEFFPALYRASMRAPAARAGGPKDSPCRLHQRWGVTAGEPRAVRSGCAGSGLDRRYRTGASPRRRPRGASGKSRPGRAVGAAGSHSPGGCKDPGGLRVREWSCIQSRPRYIAVHPA